MEECVFCKIMRREIPASVVYENDILLCFMDIEPINKGHILIIPKNHVLDLDELSDVESSEIMRISKIVVKVLKEKFKPEGYSIMQNGGIFNDVGHYHMHVFPRFKGDGFGWFFDSINTEDIYELGREISEEFNKVDFNNSRYS